MSTKRISVISLKIIFYDLRLSFMRLVFSTKTTHFQIAHRLPVDFSPFSSFSRKPLKTIFTIFRQPFSYSYCDDPCAFGGSTSHHKIMHQLISIFAVMILFILMPTNEIALHYNGFAHFYFLIAVCR